MKYFSILLLFFFVQTQINEQIKENPILLIKSLYPFVLSTTDENFYYVITKGYSMKVDKESGDIYNISENFLNNSNYIHIFDHSYNNYIYYSDVYYEIIYNPFISFNRTIVYSALQQNDDTIKDLLNFRNRNLQHLYYKDKKKDLMEIFKFAKSAIIESRSQSIKRFLQQSKNQLPRQEIEAINNNNNELCWKNVGSIAKGKEFIIYSYRQNFLVFTSKSREYTVEVRINGIDNKVSCKLINDDYYICAMIIDSKLNIYCLKYTIVPNDTLKDSLEAIINSKLGDYNYYSNVDISDFGFYDTSEENHKLLCGKTFQDINCKFLMIDLGTVQNSYDLDFYGDTLYFTTSYNFTEKNCYFSVFNNKDLKNSIYK